MGRNINGNLTVNTGVGSDWVYIANTPITGNVSINTGAGADTAQLQNMVGTIGGSVDIQLYSSLAEKDADVAWLDHVAANGNINVRAGDGADIIHLDHVTSYKDFNLDAGAGDDKLEINYACAVDNFFAKLGDGNDNATVTDLYTIHGKTQFDGGNGNDSLTKTGAFPTVQLTQTGFEWINGRPVLKSPTRSATRLPQSSKPAALLRQPVSPAPRPKRPRGFFVAKISWVPLPAGSALDCLAAFANCGKTQSSPRCAASP